MRQTLTIVTIILLFVVSILIFWAGLAPVSFSKFFAEYPVVNNTINKIGNMDNQAGKRAEATPTEIVSGSSAQIIIDNSTWKVEVVDSDASRENGLSNRKVLYPKNGMLFVFDKMAAQTFWMKDMLIPLDMIFFDNNWKIVLIESNLQPDSFPKIFGGNVISQYVLEVNAGEAISYNLKVGDKAIFLSK